MPGAKLDQHQLLIGTYGWQHPVWEQEYYPEGLPPEWQLGYYGNEHPVVMVPASYWHSGSDIAKEWLSETDASPEFVCEWPQDDALVEPARQGIGILGQRVLAIVVSPTRLLGSGESDWLLNLSELAPLVFDFNQLDKAQHTSQIEQLSRIFEGDGYGVCWHGDETNQHYLKHGRIGMLRVDKVADPKRLRWMIETVLAQENGGRTMMFIVDGDPPDMQLVQNAGIILDLL